MSGKAGNMSSSPPAAMRSLIPSEATAWWRSRCPSDTLPACRGFVSGSEKSVRFENATVCHCLLHRQGTLFSIDPLRGTETMVIPSPARQTVHSRSASGRPGTVFSLDPATGAENVLHTFGSNGDGGKPGARLLDVNGTLYGTTLYGGAY